MGDPAFLLRPSRRRRCPILAESAPGSGFPIPLTQTGGPSFPPLIFAQKVGFPLGILSRFFFERFASGSALAHGSAENI